jgi:hypothetical protein
MIESVRDYDNTKEQNDKPCLTLWNKSESVRIAQKSCRFHSPLYNYLKTMRLAVLGPFFSETFFTLINIELISHE